VALAKFEFLTWFDAIVVSGAEGMRKPDAQFYQLLLNRYAVNPSEALFIDDNYRNILAAKEMGIESVHFASVEGLKAKFSQLKII